MFRPPFIARVAAGAAVYAIEETRRLPTVAMNFPITAISQLLQTTMHAQQFVTSLALKGDAVFDRLANRPVEQPEWATFDEDETDEQTFGIQPQPNRMSRFDLYGEPDPAPAESTFTAPQPPAAESDATPRPPAPESNFTAPQPTTAETAAEPEQAADAPEPGADREETPAATAPSEPEVAVRYDYATMTLAQLRARLRVLTLDDLAALLDYELETRNRAPFVTMLTNRIATVQAK
ncbi:lipid droplet-associated protein [Nocardia sp. CDC159]|uniref:Lipid droplet-associated protein n=1 Tax=Nocardia pulmonis TaxID=2951408 RepID=A0A9X2E984_9NOCA|nr:lipid droplet-associated protein [Nocardia pulmonis]MCM6775955.1 lipid droplet-associated protein [Nocardia pulmonis]MCM6788069.1 lipid droplet-associated protein [Nocardia sp. CDC159]